MNYISKIVFAVFLVLVSCKDEAKENSIPFNKELSKKQLKEFYPNITDTIKKPILFSAEKLEMKPSNNVFVTLLHNQGAFDEIFICTHDRSNKIIDKKFIGIATDFDKGKSHTIEKKIINNNVIIFEHIDWGYVNQNDIDTIRFRKNILMITNSGRIIEK